MSTEGMKQSPTREPQNLSRLISVGDAQQAICDALHRNQWRITQIAPDGFSADITESIHWPSVFALAPTAGTYAPVAVPEGSGPMGGTPTAVRLGELQAQIDRLDAKLKDESAHLRGVTDRHEKEIDYAEERLNKLLKGPKVTDAMMQEAAQYLRDLDPSTAQNIDYGRLKGAFEAALAVRS